MRATCAPFLLCAACGSATPLAGDGETTTGGSTASDTTGTPSTSEPGTSSTTAPGDTTGSDDGSTGVDTDTGTGFELEVHTELVDGALALRCNLPRALAECRAVPGAPCEDVDGDGLTDAWEDVALERLRPLRRLDEAEPLLDDPAVVLGDVGRVFAVGENVRVFVMLGYSSDYGSCGGISAHNGDSERVALDLVDWPDGGAGGVQVTAVYTAAHENTANDHSRLFPTADLGLLVHDLDPTHGEPRWVVFPSASKHGTYANIEICEGISAVPCLDEDCGADGVEDPAAYDRVPVVVNAGEPELPRVTALDEIGFVGDDAWAEQDFCGGLGGSGCSAPVREKLTVDPFG